MNVETVISGGTGTNSYTSHAAGSRSEHQNPQTSGSVMQPEAQTKKSSKEEKMEISEYDETQHTDVNGFIPPPKNKTAKASSTGPT